MAEIRVPEQSGSRTEERQHVWTLTPALLASIAEARRSSQCSLRVSVSTQDSESGAAGDAGVLRKKVWRRKRYEKSHKVYTDFDDAHREETVEFWLRIEQVYNRLEEEIEPFCMAECRPKQRDCHLSSAPVSALLLKRRGQVCAALHVS